MHLLAKVTPQLPVPVPLVQQSPEPFGVVPIGQVPLNEGVVHEPPAVAERLHLNCSPCASRQRLPPFTVAETDAIKILSDRVALPPQFVPKRHVEKATPVPEAHGTELPAGPVLSSV